jgi:2-keto-4-pentenoate hydratase/2-oxohepta-3-ene-1,7-dioic acid hydratase in catechol pathway
MPSRWAPTPIANRHSSSRSPPTRSRTWCRAPWPTPQGSIWLKVNGQTKQSANLNQMIWSVAEQISKLSEAFELMPGDIIYSGAPENVGPVVRGDVIECHIDRLPNLSVKII